MEIKKIGVVGSGIMGNGIANNCAQVGYEVVMSDISEDYVKKGLAAIDRFLSKSVEKQKMSQAEKDTIMGRIKITTDLNDFSDVDYVIEAVPEELKIKQDVFAKLDKICKPETIIASNTSTLMIINIAAVTNRADKVIGTHFANPVPLMRVVEVVDTIATSDETLAVTREVMEKMGKTVVVAKDGPGFLSNQLSTPLLLQAIRLLERGEGTREDIDTLMTKGMGHPMGPLQLLDMIGIDTVCKGAQAIYDELKDPQFLPPVLMKQMVAMGWHGRKTGKGFYEYNKK